MINRPMLCGCHQPGAGIIRDAIARPLFECRDESILRQFFGHPDVADNPRDSGDQAGGFDPPDGVDGQMNVRGDHCTDHSIPGCIRASKADGARRKRPTSLSLAESYPVAPAILSSAVFELKTK
jgi:hypothetical protein